jgi:hypothetical protein
MAGKMKYSLQLLILFFTLSGFTFAQPKNNLEIFKDLSDSISTMIINELSYNASSVQINSLSNSELNILYNFIQIGLVKKGINISNAEEDSEKLTISFIEAKVHYDNLFKEHFLGKYYINRKIILTGSFLLMKSNKAFDFTFSALDTVEFEEFRNLENKLYPFTQGNQPETPFFSSIVEPAIAIAASATAIILFFTIRSK